MTRAVAYFGTYEPDYPRNAVLIAGLREHGVEVHEFRAALPPLTAAEMAGARGAARLAAGVAAAHARLAAQHRGSLEVDAVIVGYPGHFLVPFGRVLAAVRHARLVFDPLVSLLDTFAGDRGLVRSGGAKAAAVRAVDEVAFRLPQLVLADTWAHAAYYQEAFGLARSRVAVAPVGALPEPRADGAARELAPGEPLTVLQYGKWSPLHGADVVLGAAELLRAEPFRFVLIGEGQLSAELRGDHRRARPHQRELAGAAARRGAAQPHACRRRLSRRLRPLREGRARRAQQGLRRAGLRPARGHRRRRRRARVAARRRDGAAHAGRRSGRPGGRPAPAARRRRARPARTGRARPVPAGVHARRRGRRPARGAGGACDRRRGDDRAAARRRAAGAGRRGPQLVAAPPPRSSASCRR